jgi:PDZ domain
MRFLNTAATNSEAFRIIAAFLAELQDSHTFFLPPSRVHHMDRGFHMEMIGEACFITRVRPGSEAATKLHVGDRILIINGFKVERNTFDMMRYFFEVLVPVPDLELILQAPSGERRKEKVTATFGEGKNTIDLTEGPNGYEYTRLIREEENDEHLSASARSRPPTR